ncbi:hypothetical protein SEPCBS57363_006734 [Sporothrix epigloea]|uniref:BRCT domain-containing protein n=1 Tax=Sporothrix epigloea TaxID=1892477 RepID=A0ABP0E8W4_9PEZI
MTPQSPPKRMTRARAAAKALTTDSSSLTSSRTSSAAGSSRTKKSTATATTASAAAKRKIRTEDNETDDEQDELGLDSGDPAVTMQKHVRAIRGRPKKTPVESGPTNETAPPSTTVSAPASRTRGRPPSKKVTASSEAPREFVRPSSSLSTATAPTASALARATKKQSVAFADEAANVVEESTKKQAKRTRATSATTAGTGSTQASGATTRISVRSASATVAARSATATSAKTNTTQKKRVTFEEPEKENIVPAVSAVTGKNDRASTSKPKAEATASAGLKAKPVRRAATATKPAGTAPSNAAVSSRSRAASGKDASDRPTAPLGPKKVTQVRLVREFDVESEDELGADIESHLKPFERSPTKPVLAAGVTPAEQNRTLANMCPDEELATRDITINSISLPTPKSQGTLLVSPARRLAQVTVNEGLMMSPARRLEGLTPLDSAPVSKNSSNDSGKNAIANTSVLFSPAKRFPVIAKHQNIGDDETLRSPVKLSLLQTPAKRPSSPKKAAVLLQLSEGKPAAVRSQELNAGPLQAYRLALGGITELTEESVDHGKESEIIKADTKNLGVSDISIDNHKSNTDVDEKNESLAQMLREMANEAVTAMPESPSRRRDTRRLSNAAGVEERFFGEGSPGDPMDVDETIMDAATTLVAMSPPRLQSPSGAFGLRAGLLDAHNVDDNDMDEDVNDTTRILFAHNETAPATPDLVENRRYSKTPLTSSGRLNSMQSTAKHPKTGELGFTPLANQLYDWRIRSPVKEKATLTSVAILTEERDEKHSPADASNAVLGLYVAGTLFKASDDKVGQSTSTEEQADDAAAEDEDLAVEFDEDVVVTEEDLDLAQEADDMSLMAPEEFEEMTQLPQSTDDTMSEASQEYGDENAIPIDPALLADGNGSSVVVPPITPQRVLTRTFHTVSKVPLRQADDSEPLPRRRSMSLARRSPTRRRSSTGGPRNHAGVTSTSTLVGASQGTRNDNGRGLTRSATVISYTPTKRESRRESRRESLRESRRKSRRESFGGPALTLEDALFDSSESEVADMPDTPTPHISVTAASVPVTPTKNEEVWSTAGTPARTPRRDLDPALLRGAVVFVDVHTTEGSDASAIFVELLAQMGAQCVERWLWNPSSPSESDDNCSRVGITHVVFKDGSKRTLDKVRESNGLVQCVGVSWVLDCERSNQWQEEAPYYIDTALMPRGGGQRRKSMEPQALLNMNGLVVETPVKQISEPSNDMRRCRTAPATPKNRRDSSLWMRTPDNECSAEKRRSYDAAGGNAQNETDAHSYDEPGWDMMPLLTPVPKTPAPEAIARYAAKIAYTSPHGSDAGNSSYYDDDGDDTLHSMQFGQEPLVTRTCPPKQRATSYHGLGAGILTREKDEGVLMRLMAARRKSLQFAPKIGSPLSKTWN